MIYVPVHFKNCRKFLGIHKVKEAGVQIKEKSQIEYRSKT
jgi:hypothetical protein